MHAETKRNIYPAEGTENSPWIECEAMFAPLFS